MSKHTPWQWDAELYPDGAFDIVTEKTFGGALVLCSRSRHLSRADEMHANAKLMAAAPELLALAKQYAGECHACDGAGILTGEVGFHEDCPDCWDIRSLIAKAEGT